MTNYVALTFDDGPSPFTVYILDILKQYNVPATFFVTGSEAKKFPDLVQRIHAEGHVIGNHTWNHPNITTLSKGELRREIKSTNSLIKKLIGKAPYLFRPPYSAINNDNEIVIKKMRMTSVLWNVDSQDWREKSASAVMQHIFNGLQSHSLIVMHDGDQHGSGPRDQTVGSLTQIIHYLQEKNYQFVTVPEFHQLAFKI